MMGSFFWTSCADPLDSIALWEFQSVHQGHLPDDTIYADELEMTSNTLIAKAEVNRDAFPAIPRELIE
jgi:ubiquitin-like 1-activating enzyme E1 A